MELMNFVNNNEPSLSAENLNKLQTNIKAGLDKRVSKPTADGTDNLGSADKKYNVAFLNGLNFGDNTIKFSWTGSRLGVYIDGTFIGNVELS